MDRPDRTFEAVVLDWDPLRAGAGRGAQREVGDRLEALCALGVHAFVLASAPVADVYADLASRPTGPGRLHVCSTRPGPGAAVYEVGEGGPAPAGATGPGGWCAAAGWASEWLAGRAVTGPLVVFITAGAEAATPARAVTVRAVDCADVVALLDAQIARRADLRVPQIDDDPDWVVELPAGWRRERAAAAIGSLGNGRAGTRGSAEDEDGPAGALFAVSGLYGGDRLLPGPVWTAWETPRGAGGVTGRRVLDLRSGLLARVDDTGGALRSVRLVSVVAPAAMGFRAEATDPALGSGAPLGAPVGAVRPGERVAQPDQVCFESERRPDGLQVGRAWAGGLEIAVAARDRVVTAGGRRAVERLAAWSAGPEGTARRDALRHLSDVENRGFDRTLAEHREGWARRWSDAEVTIEGSPDDQLAARFAVFHLLSAASDDGEAAVGARGITGDAYSGHVFWDADVFVLPVLAALRPAAARAMLEYRIRRLPAARAEAARRGLTGARFPWESAADGRDVTPRRVPGPDGRSVAVRTGTYEEHIVADVAWAADRYTAWTGDRRLLAGPGRDLVVDTARYWAGRVRVDQAGRAHIHGVMGPDEYHPVVDDNAFTNVMARWNLRRGADLLDGGGGNVEPDDPAGRVEADGWRRLADRLVDGWDAGAGLYEQFAGYFDLEPLLMAQVASPPVAADVLLGAARVTGSQLIKQADVVMLHHMLPEEVVPGSLAACLDFYGPRTAHGSSLSPAVHAALLARAGRPDAALDLFRLAARLDLDDITGTTAGGLHLAAMGGVWQALAHGFLGLAVGGGTLRLDPHLPADWKALALRFRYRGRPVGVRAEPGRTVITCDTPLTVAVGGRDPVRCRPPATTISEGRPSARAGER